MFERIIIAGAGGQGIMLLGKILAEAAMKEEKFVTWLPSYGAEVRGGTAHCMLVISSAPIGSPYVQEADSLIIMNAPSLEKFRPRLIKKGTLILNSSMAAVPQGKNPNLVAHPFSAIAVRLGNIKVANMVALGSFIACKKIVEAKSVRRAIADIAPAGRKDLIKINEQALQEGINLI